MAIDYVLHVWQTAVTKIQFVSVVDLVERVTDRGEALFYNFDESFDDVRFYVT